MLYGKSLTKCCIRHLPFLIFSQNLILTRNGFYLLQNETLIAVKAPHGTTLEVPDPDEVCMERSVYDVQTLCVLDA